MPEIGEEEVKNLLDKYKAKLNIEFGKDEDTPEIKPVTREYQEFKEEYLPKHVTRYEKLCNFAERTFKTSPDPKNLEQMKENLNICHLNCTPVGVQSFAIVAPIVFALIGILMTFVIFEGSLFMIIFFLGSAAGMYRPILQIPNFMANSWRMKASGQMVLSIFYVVTYMRHTSNLELAIEFASRHLAPPLSLDLRKVIWDVETEKYENVKESLDMYLGTWKKYNSEYIEAMHLIQGSLYESSEDRRIGMLDKSLSVILDETYEKMLHYSQNLKSPITTLHMLGIILPILGLVILPLMVSFMNGVKWFHISALYNMLLPIMVYYMGKNILAKRPSGYGSSDISDDEDLKHLTKLNFNFGGMKISLDPFMISVFIGVTLALIGFSPIIMNVLGVGDFGFGGVDELSVCGRTFCMLGYKPSTTELSADGSPLIIGPFGLGASVLSVMVVIGLGFSIGLYYKIKSKNVIEVRNKSKALEQEFASAIFQLGNRIGDGIPAEMAFGRVAESMEGTVSGNFFSAVSSNVQRMGMSVEKAIFDSHTGALKLYPSSLIESTMKVLVESARKGPLITAQALMNISQYIKQMHAVDERLKDLMAETISSMKSQIKFMTPVISGIVIGITSMITSIMGKLSVQLGAIQKSGGGGPVSLTEMFQDGLPTYSFQLIVGLYVVQICYILTVLTNGIENGSDDLAERYSLGQNMTRSTLLYSFLAITVIVAFNLVATTILSGQ